MSPSPDQRPGPHRSHPSARPMRPRRPEGPRPKSRGPAIPPQAILHEDGDVLVVDKPPGMLSARLPEDDRDSLFDFVKLHVRGKQKRPARVWIIHRLDKEASGLLVFAKTEKAFNWLKEDLRARRMHRTYLAVVEGEITGEGEQASRLKQALSGTIQSFIQDDEFGNVRSLGVGDVARGSAKSGRGRFMGPLDPDAPRLAVTHWQVVGTGKGRTLLKLRLETGRKNQIRVHMREFKHPIIGDSRFGAGSDPIHRVALHASELSFTHPATGQTVRYHCPAPREFYECVGLQAPPEAEPPAPAPEAPRPAQPAKPAAATSWDHVAPWYDQLIEEDKSDHFRHVITPGSLRLLRPEVRTPPMRILDIACGQGALCRRLAEMGVDAVGVDASPRLIEAARAHGAGAARLRFEVADARALESLPTEITANPFDAALCIMALMNMDPLELVLRGASGLLKPGGAFVGVILHPAFRAPGQTSWGWEESDRRERGPRGASRPPAVRQYRRVDGYLSLGQMPITMNPGRAAHGAEPVTTLTFHRPIQTYVRALSDAGFLLESLEEWPSMRRSQPGPRASEEDRARREIPMFLGFRAIKKA